MSIHLSIERLILNGVPLAPSDRPALLAALEAELSLLMAKSDLASRMPTGVALPRVTAPRITLAPHMPPAELGRDIARSLYAGIGAVDAYGTRGGDA